MKAIKFLTVALVALFSVNAFAGLTKDTQGWTRLQLSFNAQTFKQTEPYENDVVKTHGAALGFMKGINITRRIPLFLDLGANLTWNHTSENVGDGEDKFTFMNIGIPVNAAYKLSFSSSPINIVPFFGPNLKFNFMGVHKWVPNSGSKEKYNLLKEEEGDANIFQFGLNLGVGVNIDKFYVGYTFQPDLSPYQKDGGWKTKTINNYVTVGINF